MKKDFLPIDREQAQQSEEEFVEKHWSKKWEDQEIRGGNPEAIIGGSDQFRLLNKYLDLIQPSARILDGGCGLGLWVRYLFERGFLVAGLDISRETITRLKEKFPQLDLDYGDIRKTNYPDNHFQMYYSWGVFEHFEDGPESCFNEAARILEPEGYLIVSVPFQNQRHTRKMSKSLARAEKHLSRNFFYENKMRFYQWRLTKQELEQQLVMAGFEVVEITPIDKHEGFHRALLEKWPWLESKFYFSYLKRFLIRFIPANYYSHMLLGVGKKRQQGN